MELLQLFYVTPVAGPSLTLIKQGREHNCLIDIQLRGHFDTTFLPDASVETSKKPNLPLRDGLRPRHLDWLQS